MSLFRCCNAKENWIRDVIKADHEAIITATLPADINIPTPFLPTIDIEGAGTLSPGCGAVEVEKGKGGQEKQTDSARRKIE